MSDKRPPSPPAHDAAFDAFLREQETHLAALYRKLPQAEPDGALDARIRAQAHRAVQQSAVAAQAHLRTPSRARRWLPALGAAATLLLVAGLGWRLLPPHVPPPSAAVQADAPSPADAAPTLAQAQPTAAPAPTSLDKAAPQPPPAQSARADYAQESRRAGSMKPAPAPAPAPQATPQKAMIAAPAPAPAFAPAPAPASAPHPVDTESAAPASAATQSVEAAAPRARAPLATQAEALSDGAVPARTDATDAAHIERDAAQPERYHWRRAGPDQPNAQAASGTYPPDLPPVDLWFAIVRALREDARMDAAKRALADLRHHHPDVAIPADLRALP